MNLFHTMRFWIVGIKDYCSNCRTAYSHFCIKFRKRKSTKKEMKILTPTNNHNYYNFSRSSLMVSIYLYIFCHCHHVRLHWYMWLFTEQALVTFWLHNLIFFNKHYFQCHHHVLSNGWIITYSSTSLLFAI